MPSKRPKPNDEVHPPKRQRTEATEPTLFVSPRPMQQNKPAPNDVQGNAQVRAFSTVLSKKTLKQQKPPEAVMQQPSNKASDPRRGSGAGVNGQQRRPSEQQKHAVQSSKPAKSTGTSTPGNLTLGIRSSKSFSEMAEESPDVAAKNVVQQELDKVIARKEYYKQKLKMSQNTNTAQKKEVTSLTREVEKSRAESKDIKQLVSNLAAEHLCASAVKEDSIVAMIKRLADEFVKNTTESRSEVERLQSEIQCLQAEIGKVQLHLSEAKEAGQKELLDLRRGHVRELQNRDVKIADSRKEHARELDNRRKHLLEAQEKHRRDLEDRQNQCFDLQKQLEARMKQWTSLNKDHLNEITARNKSLAQEQISRVAVERDLKAADALNRHHEAQFVRLQQCLASAEIDNSYDFAILQAALRSAWVESSGLLKSQSSQSSTTKELELRRVKEESLERAGAYTAQADRSKLDSRLERLEQSISMLSAKLEAYEDDIPLAVRSKVLGDTEKQIQPAIKEIQLTRQALDCLAAKSSQTKFLAGIQKEGTCNGNIHSTTPDDKQYIDLDGACAVLGEEYRPVLVSFYDLASDPSIAALVDGRVLLRSDTYDDGNKPLTEIERHLNGFVWGNLCLAYEYIQNSRFEIAVNGVILPRRIKRLDADWESLPEYDAKAQVIAEEIVMVDQDVTLKDPLLDPVRSSVAAMHEGTSQLLLQIPPRPPSACSEEHEGQLANEPEAGPAEEPATKPVRSTSLEPHEQTNTSSTNSISKNLAPIKTNMPKYQSPASAPARDLPKSAKTVTFSDPPNPRASSNGPGKRSRSPDLTERAPKRPRAHDRRDASASLPPRPPAPQCDERRRNSCTYYRGRGESYRPYDDRRRYDQDARYRHEERRRFDEGYYR